ncbi:Prolyl endopeptidase [Dirofilaria immitis]
MLIWNKWKIVADPYRWLEDPDLNETKEFVEKLNSISQPFIASSPYREKLRKRLTELWNHEKFGCSSRRGDYYYYYYNSGLQNQSVLYRQKTLHGKSEVFLDPNKLSEDGTTSVRQHSFTHDGSILAYGLSEKGSDWMTVKFKKADGIDLNDTILGVKHSNLDWLIDNSGVFYSTYPEHKSALEGSSTEKHEYHSLYFHKLGTSQSDDVLVADFRSHPEYMCEIIARAVLQNKPNLDEEKIITFQLYDLMNYSQILKTIQLMELPKFFKNIHFSKLSE